MEKVELRGYAKINLSLDVTGIRPNGYHEVKMVMQSIALYDNITLEKIEGDDIIMSVGAAPVPADKTNLIYKACIRFFEATGIRQGVKITLDKHIPVAAGLAGGSTDAAAVLKGLNQLCEADLSVRELCEIGVKIGADVPFCIVGGTVLAEGIGEVLTELKPAPQVSLLIVKPETGISTKLVYDKLAPCDELNHPDVDRMIKGIDEGSLPEIIATLGNVLESVTIKELPFIDDIKKEMLRLGADGSLMSGSGTTVFGIFSDEEKAKTAYKAFKMGEYGQNTYLTSFISP
jgi:4-diphosphocytidyl-2-C-methyl-D-erythritol kinase